MGAKVGQAKDASGAPVREPCANVARPAPLLCDPVLRRHTPLPSRPAGTAFERTKEAAAEVAHAVGEKLHAAGGAVGEAAHAAGAKLLSAEEVVVGAVTGAAHGAGDKLRAAEGAVVGAARATGDKARDAKDAAAGAIGKAAEGAKTK